MERLTGRYKNGVAYLKKCLELKCDKKCDECTFLEDEDEKLATYEDLDEKGLLLRLPCEIGTLVYRIYRVGKIREEKTGKSWGYIRHTFQYEDIEAYMDGYIFLTYEEAEAKLKEMESEEHERSMEENF